MNKLPFVLMFGDSDRNCSYSHTQLLPSKTGTFGTRIDSLGSELGSEMNKHSSVTPRREQFNFESRSRATAKKDLYGSCGRSQSARRSDQRSKQEHNWTRVDNRGSYSSGVKQTNIMRKIELEKLERENYDLKSELKIVQENLEWFKTKCTEIGIELQTANSELEHKREKYENLLTRAVQVRDERDMIMKDLEAEVTELKEKLERCDKERSSRNRSKSPVSVLHGQSSVEHLRQELNELNEKHTKHLLEVYNFQDEARNAKKVAAERKKENNKLTEDLSLARDEIARLKKRNRSKSPVSVLHGQSSVESLCNKLDELNKLHTEHVLERYKFKDEVRKAERVASERQKENDELMEELSRAKDEIARLKKSVVIRDSAGREYRVTQLWERVQSLEAELKETKKELDRHRQKYQALRNNEVTRLQKDIGDEQLLKLQKEKSQAEKESNRLFAEMAERLEKELLEQRQESERLKRENAAVLRQKDKRIAELAERLSVEMEAKVSADESNLENICIKSRPTTIASDYELLCSNEWLGAKQALDEHSKFMSEDERLMLLCKILTIGLDVSNRLQKQNQETLTLLIQNPGALDKGKGRHHTSGEVEKLPTGVQNALLNVLRLNVERADMSSVVQEITDAVRRESPSAPLGSARLRTYVESVARITWTMSIQRPPMTFSQSGEGKVWQGAQKQDVFWTSSNPESRGSRVKFYVHPALYHGDILMVKGRVLLEEKSF